MLLLDFKNHWFKVLAFAFVAFLIDSLRAQDITIDLLPLLSDTAAHHELELSKKQQKEIASIQATFKKQFSEKRELIRSLLPDLPPAEKRAALEEHYAEINELKTETAATLSKTLLANQKQRLHQIFRRRKFAKAQQRQSAGLLSDMMVTELDLTPEQQDALRKKIVSVNEKLEKQIAKLREQALMEISSELTTQQKSKLNDLLGAPLNNKN